MYKPFLRWVGGKTQIIDNVINTFPTNMQNYHEPFIGGGSVLLGLLKKISDGKINVKHKIYAYDSNILLIDTYKYIQSNPLLFHTKANYYASLYNKSSNKQTLYYTFRDKFNSMDHSINKCVLFYILNCTCFRGLFRVSSTNGFNVAYGGKNKHLVILNKQQIIQFSIIFSKVSFICCDFKKALINVKPNDFVYMDPPYYPIKPRGFIQYNQHNFSNENHLAVFNFAKYFKKHKIKFSLSNSNSPFIRRYLHNFSFITFPVKRFINSLNPGLQAFEVIIT